MMNLLRIQYFLKLCETLHFTDAARQLSISQPALTKAICQLETELGTRLIRREGRHTHLTRHGESARKKYQDLMQYVSTVESDVWSIVNDHNERIKLVVTPTIDFSVIAKFLSEFYEKHQKVNYEIIECGIADAENILLDGTIDCIITNDCEQIYKRVNCIKLYQEKLVVASSEDTLPDVSQWLEHQPNTQGIAKQGLTSTQVFSHSSEPKCIAQCSQQLWAQQLTRAGLGFCVLPNNGDRIRGVQIANVEDVIQKQMIYAAIPSGRSDSNAFRLFVEALKHYNWEQN